MIMIPNQNLINASSCNMVSLAVSDRNLFTAHQSEKDKASSLSKLTSNTYTTLLVSSDMRIVLGMGMHTKTLLPHRMGKITRQSCNRSDSIRSHRFLQTSTKAGRPSSTINRSGMRKRTIVIKAVHLCQSLKVAFRVL